jgi:hypothetical protein
VKLPYLRTRENCSETKMYFSNQEILMKKLLFILLITYPFFAYSFAGGDSTYTAVCSEKKIEIIKNDLEIKNAELKELDESRLKLDEDRKNLESTKNDNDFNEADYLEELAYLNKIGKEHNIQQQAINKEIEILLDELEECLS